MTGLFGFTESIIHIMKYRKMIDDNKATMTVVNNNENERKYNNNISLFCIFTVRSHPTYLIETGYFAHHMNHEKSI